MGYPGTDLLFNTGFEEVTASVLSEWQTTGAPQWIHRATDAHNGEGYVRVTNSSYFFQRTPIPSGVKNLELTQWVKAAQSGEIVPVRLQLSWEIRLGKFMSSKIEVVQAETSWTEYQMKTAVPPGAKYAVVTSCNNMCFKKSDFDEVHLYTR